MTRLESIKAMYLNETENKLIRQRKVKIKDFELNEKDGVSLFIHFLSHDSFLLTVVLQFLNEIFVIKWTPKTLQRTPSYTSTKITTPNIHILSVHRVKPCMQPAYVLSPRVLWKETPSSYLDLNGAFAHPNNRFFDTLAAVETLCGQNVHTTFQKMLIPKSRRPRTPLYAYIISVPKVLPSAQILPLSKIPPNTFILRFSYCLRRDWNFTFFIDASPP